MTLEELKKISKETGKSLTRLYLDMRRNSVIKLTKKLPLLCRVIFNKRYILPNFRVEDYPNQEACDYLMLDIIMGLARGEFELEMKNDEVLSTQYVAVVRQIEFDRPTLFLEKELGFPMIKTKLPDDYFISDIKWKWPAFRVYLPKGLLNIKRNGKKSSLMFIDITKIEKNALYDLSKEIRKEIRGRLGVNFIPPFRNAYEGFGVSGCLDFDSEESCIGYAGSSPLDGITVKKLIQVVYDYDMNKAFPSDQIDKRFVNQMLSLGLNILLYLSSYPLEYELKKDVIRPPKQEGKRTITGLYKAKFVGESQLRPYNPSKSKGAPVAPTGAEIAAHWVSGHWKRIWFGVGKKESRLQWIGIYHTGKEEEANNAKGS